MKLGKKLLVLAIAVAMIFTVVACNNKKNDQGDGQTGSTLTPNDITKLDAITNYGIKKEDYDGNPITYGDTSTEKGKLDARIADKQDDAKDPEASSIIKIFAASDAASIIKAMEDANLPFTKMQATVDYMAGEKSVSEDEIIALVNKGEFKKEDTEGWSFFDDWSYYDKLKDRADDASLKGNDKKEAKRNVKRQYRNILGKVIDLGMNGAEFARVAVYELAYATDVVEGMAEKAGKTNAKLTIAERLNGFDQYCQESLDYETLVYLRAFNEHYNFDGSNNGKQDCVTLYGYYYEYNKTDYESQTDDEFEKQLIYADQKIYSNDQWLEYVALQRKSYTAAYRYTDQFYEEFYKTHFAFQKKVEKHEGYVYAILQWNSKSYTDEMLAAINDGGLAGQLNFTDWLWCYSADKDVMKEYNAANTDYEEGKGKEAEVKYEGQFKYDMEQLKMIYYILNNMTATNLSRTLRFQVYSYSGEMVKSAQSYNKDSALVIAERKTPEKAINLIDNLNTQQLKKNYAIGKIKAILSQMEATYTSVNVKNKATQAANQSWAIMRDEVKEAIDKDYNVYDKWKKKVEALEDTVIKRTWSCKGDDETCGKPENANRGHVGCKKEYDTEHKISQFVSNYEVILRYMAGTNNVNFYNDAKATDVKPNNYAIKRYPTSGAETYTPGFNVPENARVVSAMVKDVERLFINEISVKSGRSFAEEMQQRLEDNPNDTDYKWYKPAQNTAGYDNYKALKVALTKSLPESDTNNKTRYYTYTYEFVGWFLDSDLVYFFNEDDAIRCDLNLYAGYKVTKTFGGAA